MNVAEWLMRSARREPDAPALFMGEQQIATYGEFAAAASGLAAYFAGTVGIEPGDRVAIYMANRVEYLQAMYSVWLAGAVTVPINAKLHWKEAADIIGDSGSKLAIVEGAPANSFAKEFQRRGALVLSVDDEAFAQAAFGRDRAAEAQDRADTDPAWLFYTSGTTGKPKGAILSHGNLIAMSLAYLADVDAVGAADAALYAAPMSHGAGLYNFVHVLRGSRHVVPASGFDPLEILALARAVGPISMFAAPTMVRRLTDAARRSGQDGEGIRTIVYGGGPMYLADLKDALEVFGSRFVQIYGQGETPMCITALGRSVIAGRDHPDWERRANSVGLPQACVEVKLVDETGEAVPTGSVGEIVVRGPTVMAGYWKDPDATRQALHNGWLWTGDLGSFDDHGFLTLTGRSKEVIISGGSNVYPREVEECLLLHPAVEEASVIGVPDAEWGEIVVAFVVARDGVAIDAAELDLFCKDHIARFKKPKRYIFIEHLPMNNYGKVLKNALREFLKPAFSK